MPAPLPVEGRTVIADEVPADGRSARRTRNRNAVLDAVHELFTEVRAFPTLESVAARSGVSLRSIHRYFPDSQGLMLEALARRVGVTAALYELPDLGEGALAERIDRLVAQRLTIYEEASATIRVALAVQDSMPLIAEQVQLRQARLLAQLEQQFAPELAALDPRRASSVVACADVLTQFEGVERLHRVRGLPLDEVRRILVDGLSSLLTAAPTG